MSIVTEPPTRGNAPAADPPPPPERTPRPAATSGHRREPRSLVTSFVGYAILIFFALVFLYPFVIQIASSFKTEPDAAANPLSPVPNPVDLDSFQRIFEGTNFPLWLGNSLLVTVVVTLGRVFLDSLAGYALARLRFRGRTAIFAAVVAVMAVPGVVLLIPKFLVLNQLGIYNTYTALILPLLVDASGVFIMKQFFESVPPSVEEAARIDGAGVFRTFWSVVLPTARPALITLTILSFQGSWNEFPHSLVAVQDPNLFTLPRGLADLVSGSLGAGTQYPLKLGAALLATIPVAIIFVVFQRYFVRDANQGADKG
ncbi:carbohydrate ABC transporter permease [Micromonospora sp. NBC_01796]|uniref:carbohydrate ABC transporter permease n=1 Tax=Micromonospora sp. NBC_01796 TaxID=2975987 RepID=UPI002DDC7A4E|nr:carbohydrate ABC transporter permease [Micromonospora sp. NBC_01796]WSA87001.1 carbohydrate ABC transporter permease [Micromonospora sp. NBC_01796]